MKIGIDARFFGPIGKGLGRYTERLIENLEKIDKKNEYIVFLRKEAWDLYKPQNSNFKKALADYRWYSWEEQVKMPGLIKKYKIDLMHFPHFNIPVLYHKKFVVTIHDLILFRFPTRRATTLSPLFYSIKYWVYKKVIKSAAKRAEKIITVSNCTKKDIVKLLGAAPEKIEVTYEACDGVEAGQLKMPEKNSLEKYGIKKPYLLYVGNAYPHKNLESLIEVFKKLVTDKNFEYQLILVGKEDYFYKRIKKELPEFHYSNDSETQPIIFFGFASEETLADLYRNASLYVFPSHLEGFGLPPLEAMSYGLPVAASGSSCLPEILDDAAIYFDPDSEEEMTNAILQGLNNQKLRENLILKGYKQVKKYSWESCAKKTLEIYKKAFNAKSKKNN